MLSPYVAFGSNAINAQENTGYSWYHSFQFTASKRFAKGYTVQGSYTLQKWMQAVNLLNASDLAPVREISDSDAPHRINISAVWSLPFGKGRALLSNANPVVSRIVGGWEVSGIWSIQSGFPLPWGNSIYYGNPADIQLPLDQRSPEHWFNVANFETASAKQLLSNQLRTWPLRFSHSARTAAEQYRPRVDQADPHFRGQEHRVPRRGPQRRQPPVFPEPEHDGDRRAERQGHRLRADQRIDHEQLRPPAAAQPAVPVLKSAPANRTLQYSF